MKTKAHMYPMHKILKCKKTVEMEKSLACFGRTEIQVPTYVQNNVQNNVQVLYKQRKLQLALTTLVSFVRKNIFMSSYV